MLYLADTDGQVVGDLDEGPWLDVFALRDGLVLNGRRRVEVGGVPR